MCADMAIFWFTMKPPSSQPSIFQFFLGIGNLNIIYFKKMFKLPVSAYGYTIDVIQNKQHYDAQ